MVAETVRITVAPDGATARVRADFNMHNLGEIAEQMAVWFPLCSDYAWFKPITIIEVSVNGSPATVTINDVEMEILRDGEMVKVLAPCSAEFQVSFPPGEDVSISVSYIQDAYYWVSHGNNRNYVAFSYTLSTGAGWKGTIGSAEIFADLSIPAQEASVMEVNPQGHST